MKLRRHLDILKSLKKQRESVLSNPKRQTNENIKAANSLDGYERVRGLQSRQRERKMCPLYVFLRPRAAVMFCTDRLSKVIRQLLCPAVLIFSFCISFSPTTILICHTPTDYHQGLKITQKDQKKLNKEESAKLLILSWERRKEQSAISVHQTHSRPECLQLHVSLSVANAQEGTDYRDYSWLLGGVHRSARGPAALGPDLREA